jgi:hypothetical protein
MVTSTSRLLAAAAISLVIAASLTACGVADAVDPAESEFETAVFTGAESPTPILISVSGKKFDLTDAAGGVDFDIDNDAALERTSWTTAASDDAFLVLDRNANNTIDNGSELFGDVTPQPASPTKNGFLALAEYDKVANGGNADGRIDSHDAIFSSLRLWQDTNHNGISEAGELHTLTSLDVTGIDLKYHTSGKHDKFGNRYRYQSKVFSVKHSGVGKKAYDVIFVIQ